MTVKRRLGESVTVSAIGLADTPCIAERLERALRSFAGC